jgi:LacI family transcriptional regulator
LASKRIIGILGNEGKTMTMDDRTKSAGIKDIARALHVSIGTVDRALHNRPGISEKTKVRVLQVAEKLGYQPNLAAQTLKLNKRLSIAAILPKHISYFFDPLRAGIRAAAAAVVGMQVHLEFHEYPRLGTGDVEAFQRALSRHYDGIIFLPGDMRKFNSIIRKLARGGSAMMCVGSDAPDAERIGSVTAHAFISGAIAAELLTHKLNDKGNVAIFTGELSTLDHAEKLRGFSEALATLAPHLSLLPALEGHERPREAYRQALALMRDKARPEGIYLSTANSVPVLKALDELGLIGKVQIVATDLFQELVPLIESGNILATLYQRPYTQGKLAFEKLMAYLVHENKSGLVIRLAPHVIFRSNLPLFTDHQPGSEDKTEVESFS